VSLIESALAKLRRAGEAAPESADARPRPVVTALNTQAAPVQAAPVRLAREYDLKRIKIDAHALRSAGYCPEEGLERRFADHFRHIKRPLIDKALSGSADMRLVLICSALPGDGKTFTTLNLALSMARERNTSVLLVDADASKARLSEILGLRTESGLLEALGDDSVDVESLIVETDVPGLEILPAGRFVESAHELIASVRMDQIAARLAGLNKQQLVLFDSAPLLVSSDARALMRVSGQVVPVARAGVTPRHAVQEAVANIDRKKLQGLIVNQVTVSSVGGYYGYYASYGEPGKSTPAK